MSNKLNIHEEKLPILQYGRSFAVSEEFLKSCASPSVDKVLITSMMDGVWTISFSRYFPAKTLGRFRWPKNWWEAFRERWFPAWLIRRRPIHYTTIDIQQLIDMAIPPQTRYQYLYTVQQDKTLLPIQGSEDVK